MPNRILRPEPPTADEEFYAKALTALSGPNRRVAIAMRALSAIYWLMMIGMMAWLFSQAIDRNAPVAVRSAEVLTGQVKPGDSLKVRYFIQRYRTCLAETSWSLYDGGNEVRRFGPISSAAAGPPGPDTYIRAWPIPPNASPGTSRLRVTLSFQCPGNYLHAVYPIQLHLPELVFDIVR